MINLELSDSEKKELQSVIRYLVKNEFVPAAVIQPKTGALKDNYWYDRIRKYEEWIKEYVSFQGLRLSNDKINRIYYLQAEEEDTASSLNEFETCFLLLLRVIYDEKMQDPNAMPLTTIRELREKGSDTGILFHRMVKKQFYPCLKYLKSKNIISYAGRTEELNEDAPIFINDAIVLKVSQDKISELLEYAVSKHAEPGVTGPEITIDPAAVFKYQEIVPDIEKGEE